MSDLLPKGLQFLQIGWWVSHVLAIWLIYVWAYKKGRRDEKTAQLHRSGSASKRPGPPGGASPPESSRPA